MGLSRGYGRLNFLSPAGGTREYIDPVRFISNASSGKMGYALAQAALKGGHKVTLITGPTGLLAPRGARIVRVETTADMFAAVRKHFGGCDCLVMAGAVSDFTPARPAKSKIKRRARGLTLRLKPTPDIVKWAGERKRKGQIVVGFALEDRDLRVNAEKKLRQKSMDMIVANRPAAVGKDGCGVEVKTVTGDWLKMPWAKKTETAVRLVRLMEKLFQ